MRSAACTKFISSWTDETLKLRSAIWSKVQ